MKTLLTKFILATFAFMPMLVMPLAAQTAQQKADEINASGQAAEQTQSATDSRAIDNAAWDSAQGGPSEDISSGKTDIIGGDSTVQNDEEKSTFDSINPEDVTPWKAELELIHQIVMYALSAMMVGAFILTAGERSARTVIGTAIIFAAAAACAVAMALSIVVMAKYKQYALGGLWLGICTLCTGMCVSAALCGIDEFRNAATSTRHYMTTKIALFASLMAVGGMIGAFVSSNKTEETVQQQQRDAICPQDSDNQICDKGDDGNTGSLPHYLRSNIAEIETMDC